MFATPYTIADTSDIYSPALLFYKDLIRQNIARLVEMAGSPEKLRLHVKTHKTAQVMQMCLEAGIHRCKCATLAEAEMAARVGCRDVLIAYSLVGPNLKRLVKLLRSYPATRFSVLVDHPLVAENLSALLSREGLHLDVVLDVDVGQHRTGIAPGQSAIALYEQISRLPGLRPDGLHAYDGHNHQIDTAERRAAAMACFEAACQLREALLARGLPVPRLICGGTPTFPIYAGLQLPGLECSPGTLVLHDNGYGSKFADLSGFVPAALVLTRVISKPAQGRVTFDLGYKAIASDPPAGQRFVLLDLPDARAVAQNEEHLVIETAQADRLQPGDEVLAIPTHVCPTVSMHQQAYLIEKGRLTDIWDITARGRVLSV
jgi:D-serine deaminase-like pyridoxal phosphate-dependent protein